MNAANLHAGDHGLSLSLYLSWHNLGGLVYNRVATSATWQAMAVTSLLAGASSTLLAGQLHIFTFIAIFLEPLEP